MKPTLFITYLTMSAGLASFAGDSTTGVISTIAGNGSKGSSGDGGPAISAQLNSIAGITIDPAGNLYIADNAANNIRKVSPDGVISTVVERTAGLNPLDVALDAADNLYVAAYEHCGVVKVTPTGTLSILASNICFPNAIASDSVGNVYVATMSLWDFGSDAVHKVSPDGTVSGVIFLGNSSGMDVDSAGNVYIAASSSLWKVDPQGSLTRLPFNDEATDVAVDRAGNIFVADYSGSRIRMLSPSGMVTTIAGNGTIGFSGDGGPATSAQLNGPTSVAIDRFGNILVGDSGNRRIRRITRGIEYYNISGMPYNDDDISFWYNFAENVWYSGNKAGEISLVGACPPWQKCGATGIGATPTQINGLTGVVAVTDGAVLKSDGTVVALRASYADRTTLISLAPVQVDGLTGVVAVSGRMALKDDGTVWSFSDPQPAQVSGLSDVVAIHQSVGGVMALKSDGTVWAWWGPGIPPFEVSKARGAVAIAEAAFGGLALMGDGTVWLFGLMGESDPRLSYWGQLGGDGIVAIDADYDAWLGLKSDGTVWELDNTSVQKQGIPRTKGISAGARHHLALAQDGTVWEWGHDYLGLGNTEKTTWPTPRQVPGLTGVTKVAGSWYHSLALLGDGTVWVWTCN